MTAGFTSVGMDVVLVGPVPTPAIGFLVRSLRADMGVMITASHNPYHDNGIKIFGADGHKLSDEHEAVIERMVAGDDFPLASDDQIGKAQRLDDVAGRYIEFIKSHFPADLTLDGMRIALDCANGAAYKIAPTVLRELGAEVVAIGVDPNGMNINDRLGATNPPACAKPWWNSAPPSDWRWMGMAIGWWWWMNGAMWSMVTTCWARWRLACISWGSCRGMGSPLPLCPTWGWSNG
jgi:phosphoglucosamine mutase